MYSKTRLGQEHTEIVLATPREMLVPVHLVGMNEARGILTLYQIS